MDSKYAQQFKKGSLEMVLLCLIAQKETYGYEIISKLNEQGGDVLGEAREGTVYPILYRLEKAGLVSSRLSPAANGGSRKFYSLTEKGCQTLAELATFWQKYARCIDRFVALSKEDTE